MAYVSPNFKTKKALKEAVAAGQAVIVFQPNRMFGSDKEFFGQTVGIEGPHYPKPHTWYAQVEVSSDGVVTRVK